MKILIFANGLFAEQPSTINIQSEDIVIAADGGARHCKKIGVIPNVAIGDFDSLTQVELEEMENQGTKIIHYPARKDFTDLELAIEYACQLNAKEVLIFGGLGLRWDQTLANVLLLVRFQHSLPELRLVDGSQEISLLNPSRVWHIPGEPGDTISLIPVGGEAEGITTQGLEYPLSHESLFFGSTRGVSNVLIENPATVELKHGMLICVLIHNRSTPQ